jgi:energy-coupling factor transport system ATP-binding protein
LQIRVEGLQFIYSPNTPWQKCALNEVSFTVPSGKVMGLIGLSGSGKTTLLKNLNGLLKPTDGKVFLDDIDSSLLEAELSRIVGLVFQCPERQLFEDTVLDDITFPFRIDKEAPSEEDLLKCKRACDDVGLDLEEIGSERPQSLSEASRRKLAIACLLVNDPRIMIFDEPLAAMDPYSSLEIVRMISRMKSGKRRTIIIASHDMAPFMTLLDLMLVMDSGKTKFFGECDDVFEQMLRDSELSELAPPVAILKKMLRLRGIEVPKNEYDPAFIAKFVSTALDSKDVHS